MQVFPVELILARPLGGSDDQAGHLLGRQFFGIDDYIEVAPIVDIDSVELEITLPVLLVPLESGIKHRFIALRLARLSPKNALGSFLQRRVQPNPEIRRNQPRGQTRTNHDLWPERCADLNQVRQKIEYFGLTGVRVNFVERDSEIVSQIAERIIDDLQP